MCFDSMVLHTLICRCSVQTSRVRAAFHDIIEAQECVVENNDHSIHSESWSILIGGGLPYGHEMDQALSKNECNKNLR